MTMAVATIQSREIRTMAQLLHDLGDIPPERVLMDPAPGQATEADVIWMDDHADRLCELVDGVLVEKAMGYKESFLAGWILTMLQVYVLPRRLGVVTGEAGMLRLFPGLVRIPDVAFVRRIEGRKIPNKAIPPIAPTLAVEVLSESNTAREMDRKIEEYFKAGTEVVWIIDPEARLGRVYVSPEQVSVIDSSGILRAEAALPGFELSLKQMFEEMDREFEK